MKKLLTVAVAMLFVAGFAFGQGNVADIAQDGNSNSAAVAQAGASHEAYIDQFGTNVAEVDQYGGDDNYADIDQGAAGSAISDPGTPSYNGDWIGGAYIEQNGSDNDASITVRRSGAGASIFQEGSRNEAHQDLGSTQHRTTNWNRMGLDIDQIGDDNYADQKTMFSFGMFGIQGMALVQEGDKNTATQLSRGGTYATMEVYQYGSRNNNPSESGNAFDLSAVGFDPFALPWTEKPSGEFTQYQNGSRGTAHLEIHGNDNNAAQSQEYTVWGVGGDNDACLDITGDLNDAAQGQLGEYNYSDVDVMGSSNVVGTSQLGDDNAADIFLNGSSNVAGINQVGNSNDADINVFGMNNTATVVQQP